GNRGEDVMRPVVFDRLVARPQQSVSGLRSIESVRKFFRQVFVEKVLCRPYPALNQNGFSSSSRALVPRRVLSWVSGQVRQRLQVDEPQVAAGGIGFSAAFVAGGREREVGSS